MKRLLLTAGDPSGIGPEVILKAYRSLAKPAGLLEKELGRWIATGKLEIAVIGCGRLFSERAQALAPAVTVGPQTMTHKGLPPWVFHNLPAPTLEAGVLSKEAGAHAFSVLEKSVTLLKQKAADGVVTGPVSKEAIDLSRPGFIGHTEFYAQAFGDPPVSMCFTSPVFNLVLMTTHVAIKDLSACMTPETVDRALTHALELQKLTGDKKPLAVMGFNPHAGEGGLFGHEDGLIEARVAAFRKTGHPIEGPLAADSAFGQVAKGKYGTAVACYHDQGLIPLKMLSKGSSVNVTLGLPVVRTSVDHGTAFDIAGKGVAEHGSMVCALHMAARLLGLVAP